LARAGHGLYVMLGSILIDSATHGSCPNLSDGPRLSQAINLQTPLVRMDWIEKLLVLSFLIFFMPVLNINSGSLQGSRQGSRHRRRMNNNPSRLNSPRDHPHGRPATESGRRPRRHDGGRRSGEIKSYVKTTYQVAGDWVSRWNCRV
jgi:hypothetical protein